MDLGNRMERQAWSPPELKRVEEIPELDVAANKLEQWGRILTTYRPPVPVPEAARESRFAEPEPKYTAEWLPKLPPMAGKTPKIKGQAGMVLFHHTGEPWDLQAHGLIYIVDEKNRPWNKKFRRQMIEHGGERDPEERENDLPQVMKVTHGGDTGYFGFIRVPMGKVSAETDIMEYKKLLIDGLLQALDYASDLQFERVVIPVEGLCSGHFSWMEAEDAAITAGKVSLKGRHLGSNVKEVVIVTSEKRREQWRRRLVKEALGAAEETERQAEPTAEPEVSRRLRPRASSTPSSEKRAAKESGEAVHDSWEPQSVFYQEPQLSAIHPSATMKPCCTPQERDAPPLTPEIIHIPVKGQPTPTIKLRRSERGYEIQQKSPINPRVTYTILEEPEEQMEVDEHLPRDNVSDNDDEECESAAVDNVTHHGEVKQGKRRGKKNKAPLLNVYTASQRLARDLNLGYVETKDGRKTYIPEVGQTDHEVPQAWQDSPGIKWTIPVTATIEEWTNFLVAPSYPSMVAFMDLTENFRVGFTSLMYDVMLRRLKTAAKKKAKETLERQRTVVSESEEEVEEVLQPRVRRSEEPPERGQRAQTISFGGQSVEFLPTQQMGTTGPTLSELKKLRLTVAPKKPEQPLLDYLKQVWPLVRANTTCEEAKRAWLSSATNEPLASDSTAEEHYRWLVLEDVDDEDTQIERARSKLKAGQTLTQVWYNLNRVIPEDRRVRVLRKVVKGMRNEMEFRYLQPTGESSERITEVCRRWDVARQCEEERRVENIPNRGSNQGDQDRRKQQQRPSNPTAGPRFQQRPPMREQNRNPPLTQDRQPIPAPRDQKSGEKPSFIPREEYLKLTPEQRNALHEARKIGASGEQQK